MANAARDRKRSEALAVRRIVDLLEL